MVKLKIIFAGTPEFAVPVLAALLQSEHKVQAVLTQPDRPKGRGKKLTSSPVKQLALQYDIPVLQPATLRNQDIFDLLAEYKPDLMIVVAYGLIIPKAILSLPIGGCINVHASLLPKFRGAAPIQYAILSGEKVTGVTIMQMDQGLDTGPMLLTEAIDIHDNDTSLTLSKQLATIGAKLILQTLVDYRAKQLTPVLQDDNQATYAPKITKDFAQLNWQLSAIELNRIVRALSPNPYAYSIIKGERVKILATKVLAGNASYGVITNFSIAGLDVGTGNGILRITNCQFPGKQELSSEQLYNGYKNKLLVGELL